MSVKGRKYKLWGCGVGILVKEELYEKVVEVRKKSDRVMTVVMALEEEMVKIIQYECMVCKLAERVQRRSAFMMI